MKKECSRKCEILWCKKTTKAYKFCYPHSLHLFKFEGRDHLREKVRILFKHICQKCGYKWKSGRRLDIHHINGLCGKLSRSYDREVKNLLPLCHKCHLSLPEVVKKIVEHSSPRPEKLCT